MATLPPMRVGSPDDEPVDGGGEPVSGWKTSLLTLAAPGTVTLGAASWPVASPLPDATATCLVADHDASEVASATCTCGFYLLRSRAEADTLAATLIDHGRRPGWVVVAADGTGRVQHYQRGWRAQHQHVLRVCLPDTCQAYLCERPVVAAATAQLGGRLAASCRRHARRHTYVLTASQLRAMCRTEVTGGARDDDVPWDVRLHAQATVDLWRDCPADTTHTREAEQAADRHPRFRRSGLWAAAATLVGPALGGAGVALTLWNMAATAGMGWLAGLLCLIGLLTTGVGVVRVSGRDTYTHLARHIAAAGSPPDSIHHLNLPQAHRQLRRLHATGQLPDTARQRR